MSSIWCLSKAEFAGSLFNAGLLGKMGPIKIDTWVVKHNIFNQNDNEKEIILTVGCENKIIDKADIDAAYEILAKKGQKHFDSGRSYCFEGFGGPNKEGHYYFYWGS